MRTIRVDWTINKDGKYTAERRTNCPDCGTIVLNTIVTPIKPRKKSQFVFGCPGNGCWYRTKIIQNNLMEVSQEISDG